MIQRIRQKSADLRKNVTNLLERDQKKIDIQRKQLKDTEKRERFKVYGEHINTYGYQLSPEDKVLRCTSYYDGSRFLSIQRKRRQKMPINILTVTIS